MKVKDSLSALGGVFLNLKRMLRLAWEADPRLTLAYYGTAAVSSITPILLSITMKYLVDALIASQHSGLTASIPSILLIILAVRYLLALGDDIVQSGIHQVYLDYLFRYRLQNELNRRFYTKLASLDIGHLENPKTQDLITKAKDTVTWRPPDFLRLFSYCFGSVITFVSTLVILVPFGWWIPVMITMAEIPRFYRRVRYGSVQWSIYGSGAPEVRKLWHLTWILSDPTTIREMKIFQSQTALLTKFRQIQEYLFQRSKKPLDAFMRFLFISPVLETMVLFAIAWINLPMVLTGALSVGSFTLLITMIDRMSYSAASVVGYFGDLYESNLYVDYYFDVLALPILIPEADQPVALPQVAPPTIEFRHVSFHYPDGKDVLHDLSFTIRPRENVALVGANGAGKSTMIKLLCRFYDVTAGEILVNGTDIRKLGLSQWREFLGTLFQDFAHYHLTVRENITLGRSGENDEARIRDAAQKAGALEFIAKLPKQFDQMLGREFEAGEELSIGQWQKLAMARAFYEEAPVLILDEPTSAIDAEAEYEIFTNLDKVYHDKTLILVSHRFSTVRNADTIYVVEDGRIIERGTHEDLLNHNGKYAHMFTIQAKGYQ